MSKQAKHENKSTKRPTGASIIKRMLRNRLDKLHSAGRADSSGSIPSGIILTAKGRKAMEAARAGLQTDETLKPAIGRAQDRRKGGR